MSEKLQMLETRQIEKALAEIMHEAKAIGKDSRNVQQGFNFRGIDAIMNHLHPLFAKHGVIILPEVLAERTEERTTKSGGNLIYRVLTVRFHFTAADGSSVCSTVIGEGMDSGDKAANKAMAVALKYALTQMLLLPYDEKDPDADTPPDSVPKRNYAPPPADVATPVAPPAAPPNVDIKTNTPPPAKAKPANVISAKQRGLLFHKWREAGLTDEVVKAHIFANYGVKHTDEIPKDRMNELLAWIDKPGNAVIDPDAPDTDEGRKDGNPY